MSYLQGEVNSRIEHERRRLGREYLRILGSIRRVADVASAADSLAARDGGASSWAIGGRGAGIGRGGAGGGRGVDAGGRGGGGGGRRLSSSVVLREFGQLLGTDPINATRQVMQRPDRSRRAWRMAR